MPMKDVLLMEKAKSATSFVKHWEPTTKSEPDALLFTWMELHDAPLEVTSVKIKGFSSARVGQDTVVGVKSVHVLPASIRARNCHTAMLSGHGNTV